MLLSLWSWEDQVLKNPDMTLLHLASCDKQPASAAVATIVVLVVYKGEKKKKKKKREREKKKKLLPMNEPGFDESLWQQVNQPGEATVNTPGRL